MKKTAAPCRIVAVTNAKGGTGKTTLAVNLAAALAEAGETVLLCDLDPFGSASRSFGPLTDGPTLYDALFTRGRVALLETVQTTPVPRLSLAPSDERLTGLEDAFRRDPTGLRALLEGLAGFSFVLLDSPPSAGPLTVAALAAAREVLLPVTLSTLDVERLPVSLGIISEARDRHSLDLRVSIAGNRASPTRLCRDLLESVRGRYGKAVFRTVIPQSVRIGEAPAFGLPVTLHDPTGPAAEAFRALAREIRRNA